MDDYSRITELENELKSLRVHLDLLHRYIEADVVKHLPDHILRKSNVIPAIDSLKWQEIMELRNSIKVSLVEFLFDTGASDFEKEATLALADELRSKMKKLFGDLIDDVLETMEG